MGKGRFARSWMAAGVAVAVAVAGTGALVLRAGPAGVDAPGGAGGVERAPSALGSAAPTPGAVPSGAGAVRETPPAGILADGWAPDGSGSPAADGTTGRMPGPGAGGSSSAPRPGDRAAGGVTPSGDPEPGGETRDVSWDFGPGPSSGPSSGLSSGPATGPAAEQAPAPAGAQTVTRAADGVVLAPPYRSGTTYFGTALSSSDGSIDEALATNDALFGKLPVVRQFDPGLPPDGAWARRTALHDRMIVFSFRKSPAEVIRGEHDAEITRFFREAPTRKPIFYSFWHEPEPDINAGRFTASEYRAAFRRVVRLVAAIGRKNLYPTLILTGWTADPGSRRNWRDYHPGDEYISLLAWDPYNGAHGNPARYKEPEEVFGHVVRVSRAAGKPWGVAETGTALVKGDTGQGRAVWLRRSGEYLEEHGAAFVTYFQSVRDGDFKLTDQPSVRAWSKHVERSKR